jgi:hypothetical protein
MENFQRKIFRENARLFGVTTDYLRREMCRLLIFRRFQEEINVDGLPRGSHSRDQNKSSRKYLTLVSIPRESSVFQTRFHVLG